MSRSKPTWQEPAWQRGWVYTFHLLPAYGDDRQRAGHYTGFTLDLAARFAEHEGGGPAAARLLQVQRKAGGTWVVASLKRGTRDDETKGKYRGAARRCPVCKAERDGAELPTVRLAGLAFPAVAPLPEGTGLVVVPPAGLAFPASNPLEGGTAPRHRRTGTRRRLPPLPASIPQDLPF
jgi:hypothetical protein